MASPSVLEQAREIPLATILQHVGLTPRREGTTTRYKNDQFNIVVSPNNLWFDNAAAVGGRGPIDLALHLKCRANPRLAAAHHIREALDWLADLRPLNLSPASAQISEPTRPSFADQAARLAIRDDARWTLARHYLTHIRRLPGQLIDELAACQDVFACFSKSRPELTGVCFVHRSLDGLPLGATIRPASTERDGTFSIGEKATAWFTLGFPGHSRQAVLVEAPIDAISYRAMKPADGTVILAMSSAHVFPSVLHAAHERRWSLTVAFDNDRAGNTGWERCLENQRLLYPDDPPAERTMPVAKDWNEDLCAAPRRSHRRRI